MKRDDDHPPHAAQPARVVPVQRHATEDRTLSREPDLPVAAPVAFPAAPSGSLPMALRIADAGNAATEEIKHPKIETQTETPILGVRLTQAPLILQRTPVTERVSAPLEPVVQRVEFLPPRWLRIFGRTRGPPLRTPFQLPRRRLHRSLPYRLGPRRRPLPHRRQCNVCRLRMPNRGRTPRLHTR